MQIGDEIWQAGDRYRLILGQSGEPLAAALELRATLFRNGAPDRDGYDDDATHLAALDAATGQVLACCRMALFTSGASVADSYSGQFYNLRQLKDFNRPCLELGRFAVSSDASDPMILRQCWAAITHVVMRHDVGLLFGCSSFFVDSTDDIENGLAFLAEGYTAPDALAPLPKADGTVPLAQFGSYANRKTALSELTPLLKTYLKMGGWVSDHAVIDPDLGSIHVFTGVEIDKIRDARATSLRRDLALLTSA